MTDAMARLSNSIFQELDVFYSFRYIERQINENFSSPTQKVMVPHCNALGDHVILCDSL